MSGRLLVRINPKLGGPAVTVPAPDDLRFNTTLPGGFKTMSCTITRPVGELPPKAFSPWAEVRVLDEDTGATLWFGYLTDPGQGSSLQGSTYQLTAEGPQILTDGWRQAYVLVDRAADGWLAVADCGNAQTSLTGNDGFTVHPSDDLGRVQTWALQDSVGGGQDIPNGSNSSWQYDIVSPVVRIWGSNLSKVGSGYLHSQLYFAFPGGGSLVTLWDFNWYPSQANFDFYAGVGSWASGSPSVMFLRWKNVSGGAAEKFAGDNLHRWGNVVVICERYAYDGSKMNAVSSPTLTTHQVVNDLMGRGFGVIVEYDPARDSASTPEVIAHASWRTGASARDILNFCTANSPQMWWAISEPGATGLPKFETDQWTGTPRYIFSPGAAQVELSGGGVAAANFCFAVYKGTPFQGAQPTRSIDVYVPLPQLDDAGVVRTMTLDLTGEQGLTEVSDVQARATAALKQNALAKTAGKVTITEPIYDRRLGRKVAPHEVQAGAPVLVTEAPTAYSRSTSLVENVTEDGYFVFLATGVEYDHGRRTATLTLDGGSRSLLDRFRSETAPRKYEVKDPRSS